MDYVPSSWKISNPESTLISKEKVQDGLKSNDYIYELISCLTLEEIKILSLLGHIYPFKHLDSEKIIYQQNQT